MISMACVGGLLFRNLKKAFRYGPKSCRRENKYKAFRMENRAASYFSLYLASNLLLHEFRKIVGQFVSIGLVKIMFPVEEVYTVDMKQ